MPNSSFNGEKIFSCDSLQPFINTVVNVLPYRGFSMSIFCSCEYKNIQFLTKISLYRKTQHDLYATPDKTKLSQVDTEIEILNIIKQDFIDKNITPCILELVYYKKCDDVIKLTPKIKECQKISKNQKPNNSETILSSFCNFSAMITEGLAENRCAFMVIEKCDITLTDFIANSISTPVVNAIIKSIIFMIIRTFDIITVKYPRFRHYDLHSDNVLLKFDSSFRYQPTRQKYMVFPIDGVPYYVPYFGIIPKIIDFGFSQIPEKNIVSDIVTDKLIAFYRRDNDVIYLLCYIYDWFKKENKKRKFIENLFTKIDPSLSYKYYFTPYFNKYKTPSYAEMSRNPVFYEYTDIEVLPSQIFVKYNE